ncbi:non-homologous end joining protein Ku [Rhodococcus sp. UNC363MFTsu5.1]|uniref:non-homologous end joining protein Ku n=1 Tax=Rhodococcus sp. UNC363MFTsu5.1 TaxID=1449069 RepID=UPI0004870C69|nr:Ku protein [Rhodococcus sp. UNC363MFTsu5.1]
MRSIWKGSIAFGLVNVPVKVYTATEDHDIRFHQVHGADGGRIKYNRVCQECGKTIQFADIDKAYSSEDGTQVILTDEDFDELPAAEKHEIPVLQFVPSEQIDPILFEKSYYLEPDSASPKAYQLLASTLTESDRTALVHFTLRQRTRLAALRVRDGVLVIQTLLWPDEVRAAEFETLDKTAAPSDKELAMAKSLVESMSEDFEPESYTDEYQIQLQKMLDEAIKNGGKKVTPPEAVAAAKEDAEVVDLVAALQRSVDAAKSGKTDTAEKSPKSAPAKKTAKRSPARKTG